MSGSAWSGVSVQQAAYKDIFIGNMTAYWQPEVSSTQGLESFFQVLNGSPISRLITAAFLSGQAGGAFTYLYWVGSFPKIARNAHHYFRLSALCALTMPAALSVFASALWMSSDDSFQNDLLSTQIDSLRWVFIISIIIALMSMIPGAHFYHQAWMGVTARKQLFDSWMDFTAPRVSVSSPSATPERLLGRIMPGTSPEKVRARRLYCAACLSLFALSSLVFGLAFTGAHSDGSHVTFGAFLKTRIITLCASFLLATSFVALYQWHVLLQAKSEAHTLFIKTAYGYPAWLLTGLFLGVMIQSGQEEGFSSSVFCALPGVSLAWAIPLCFLTTPAALIGTYKHYQMLTSYVARERHQDGVTLGLQRSFSQDDSHIPLGDRRRIHSMPTAGQYGGYGAIAHAAAAVPGSHANLAYDTDNSVGSGEPVTGIDADYAERVSRTPPPAP